MTSKRVIHPVGYAVRRRQAMDAYAEIKALAETGGRGRVPGTQGVVGGLATRGRMNLLSPETLWQSYQFSGYIRPCIDGIVRGVSGRSWDIVPSDGRDVRTLTRVEETKRQEIKALFSDPNQNKGTWNSFIRLVLMDLLIYDAPTVEVIRGKGTGRIKSMVPLYGPSISVDQNGQGEIVKYVQKIGLEKDIEFSPEELIYAPMYCTTRSPYGLSIIQTCVDQISYLLLMADHHCRLLDRDEIPDGILFATGVNRDDIQKTILAAKQNAGRRDRLHVLGTQHPQANVEWVAFTRGSKEEQQLEIGEMAERIIARNFGLDATSANLPQKYGNRSKAEIEVAATNSSLIEPIERHLEEQFNVTVVHAIDKRYSFSFIDPRALKDPNTLDKQIRSGQCTVNETRVEQGKVPYDNAPYAARPFIEVGSGLFFLDTGEWTGKDMVAPGAQAIQGAPPEGGKGCSHTHIAPQARAHRAPVMVQQAKAKGHVGADRTYDIVTRYTKELRTAYDNFSAEAMGIANEGQVGESPISMDRAERDRKVEKVKALRDKYVGLWGSILSRYAQEAADAGTKRALLKIKMSSLAPEKRQAEIEKLVQENHGYMKDAWRKYADRIIWVINRATKGMRKGPGGLDDAIEFGDVLELQKAEEVALATAFASVEAYGQYMWAIENVIYAKEGGAAGYKVFWHGTSGNPCPDCENMAGNVWDVRDLNMFPGYVVRCDGMCYCFLEILEGEGGK